MTSLKSFGITNKTFIKDLPKLLDCDHIIWKSDILDRMTNVISEVITIKETDLDRTIEEIIFDNKQYQFEICNDQIIVNNDLVITFEKTIRLDNNERVHKLPPTIGRFDIAKNHVHAGVEKFSINISHQDAFWINFKSTSKYAIIVKAGNINCVTGEIDKTSGLNYENQNYICIPEQPWIDGIVMKQDDNYHLVRQFVCADINNSIEQKLLDNNLIENINNTISFEIYSNYDISKYYYEYKVFCDHIDYPLFTDKKASYFDLKSGSKLLVHKYAKISPNVQHTPNGACCASFSKEKNVHTSIEDLGININDDISRYKYIPKNGYEIYITNITGQTEIVYIHSYNTILELMLNIENITHIPVNQMRLIYRDKGLESHKTLSDYLINKDAKIRLMLKLRGGGSDYAGFNRDAGIVCGALIKQKIYRDLSHYKSKYSSKNIIINISLELNTKDSDQITQTEYDAKKGIYFDDDKTLKTINVENKLYNIYKTS